MNTDYKVRYGADTTPWDFNKFEVPDFSELSKLFDNVCLRQKTFYDQDKKFPLTNQYIDKENNQLILLIAISGYTKENLSIKTEGDIISLEITPSSYKAKEGYTVIGEVLKLSGGQVKYRLAEGKFNTDGILAEVENGLLILKIPFKQDLKPKKVEIK